jgi:hypothetical protein
VIARQCPVLDCSDQELAGRVERNLCFAHDLNQPSKLLRAHNCDWYHKYGITQNRKASVCEMDLKSDKFAWVGEQENEPGYFIGKKT